MLKILSDCKGHRIGHGVARHKDALGGLSLAEQIGSRPLGGGKVEGGQRPDGQTVKFLGERGGEIVGEIAFTGDGQAAKLIGLYVSPNYRRLGLAKSLIASGMKLLSERGVTHVEADVIRRSDLQRALAASCSATFVRTACYYPGMNYD